MGDCDWGSGLVSGLGSRTGVPDWVSDWVPVWGARWGLTGPRLGSRARCLMGLRPGRALGPRLEPSELGGGGSDWEAGACEWADEGAGVGRQDV